MNRIDKKWLGILLLLFTISLAAYALNDNLINVLRVILEFRWLYIFSGMFSFCVTLVHKIRFENLLGEFKEKASLEKFKEILEDLTAIILNPSILVGAIALIKGLFIQKFYNEIYFSNFGTLEINLLWLIALYLLVTASIELFKLSKETLLIRNVENIDTNN